jgi:multidrug efflux pump subunit AcrB
LRYFASFIFYGTNFYYDSGRYSCPGLIIDDAIVVVEQIHRTHEEHPEEPTTALLQKQFHLFPAMVGSSLCTIVIFLPFALMSGVGAYFKVLTDTMIITLICSFCNLILLPVYLLLTKKESTLSEVKLAKEQHKVKSQNWVAYFIENRY